MVVFFESAVSAVLTGTIALFAVVLVFLSLNFNYWKKRGVPYPTPLPIVGNVLDQVLGKASFATVCRPAYQKFRKNGYCGMFQWTKPVLMVYEPELVKQVLTKDFSTFHDRGQPSDPEGDPLSAHLFNLEGKKWRNLRNKLSPTFTSGKLKLMFPLMADVADEMNKALMVKIKTTKDIDMKDMLTRYTTDLIGSCVFGIQCNSLRGDNSEFVQMAKEVFRPNFFFLIRFFLQNIHPLLARLIPFRFILSKTTNFFINLMKDTVEYREKNSVNRNDFVNLLMQVRDADKQETDRENHIELSAGVMAAQGFIFFVAGLDNVTNSVCWSLHELSLNPALQEKAAQEIKKVMAANEGKINYYGLKQMVLVEKIIREALRKYTPIGVLFRVANRNIPLGDTGLVVEKGTSVLIPTDCMQLDPDLFPDPQRFDPERFSEEEKEKRHPYSYLPFGDGPRLCIAERFAMVELMLALASLLSSFKFSVGPKTEINPKVDAGAFGPTPINGFWLSVEPRSES